GGRPWPGGFAGVGADGQGHQNKRGKHAATSCPRTRSKKGVKESYPPRFVSTPNRENPALFRD
ncbi:MAG: hypothetical protein ACREHD_20915, partial [Pirellulales bacterium]